MPDQRDTLALVFERGFVSARGRWLFLHAAPLPGGVLRHAACEQGFRPLFDALVASGHDAAPMRDGVGHDGAALLLGRSRKVNEANLARAWNALAPGGTLVVAGDKVAGIAPIRKLAASRANVTDSLAKYHATAFWMVRDGVDWAAPQLETIVDGWHVAAGTFSADGPDPASQMLARHLQGRPLGHTADLGAGWGFLSAEAVRVANPTSLELFEADHAALELAKRNLVTDLPTAFHWHDVADEPIERRFSSVVMNPPFHSGRASEPRLGQRFIERASDILKPKGRLLMVANRNLPYERVLDDRFASWTELEASGGFKVFEAVR